MRLLKFLLKILSCLKSFFFKRKVIDDEIIYMPSFYKTQQRKRKRRQEVFLKKNEYGILKYGTKTHNKSNKK